MRAYAQTSIARYEKIVAAEPNIAKPSLFTKLFKAKDRTMSRAEIVANAEAYITAGSDTTAQSLTYLTWAVCRNESIKSKLLEELRSLPEVFLDADLKTLKYLDCVILETLRCYAAAPALLPRDVPSGGREIDGYFMSGGTEVQTQAYCMHRNPEVFPDPYQCVPLTQSGSIVCAKAAHRFYPERWEAPTKEMQDAWMPFGGGARGTSLQCHVTTFSDEA